MMKRIMACLLALVCLLTSAAFAEGLTMKVVNVNTAVNLRKGPSTDTDALGQVPAGTIVTDCVKEKDWYQVNYNGVVGYIRGDKLEVVETPTEAPAEETTTKKSKKSKKSKKAKATEAPAEQPAEQPAVAEGTPLVAEQAEEKEKAPRSVLQENVENAPVTDISQPTEYDDDFVILNENVAGVHVIGRQIYQSDCEYLMAVGLDANGNELWKNETTTDSITELMQTDVFLAGTADAPLVMMYNACRGLTAVNPADGKVVWEISKKTLDLGGSISKVVDANGILYIGGYYDPDPVAIDANGNVLWQSTSGSEKATWMYRMELRDNGIACAYGSMAGENTGTIVYGFDGSVVDVIYD